MDEVEKNTFSCFRWNHLYTRDDRDICTIHTDYYQTYIVDILVKKNISVKGMLSMFAMMGVVFALPIVLVQSLFLKMMLGFIYIAHVIGLTWYLKFHPKKVVLKQAKKDLGNS